MHFLPLILHAAAQAEKPRPLSPPATSFSSSWGTVRPSPRPAKRHLLCCVSWVDSGGLLPVGNTWNTSPGGTQGDCHLNVVAKHTDLGWGARHREIHMTPKQDWGIKGQVYPAQDVVAASSPAARTVDRSWEWLRGHQAAPHGARPGTEEVTQAHPPIGSPSHWRYRITLGAMRVGHQPETPPPVWSPAAEADYQN